MDTKNQAWLDKGLGKQLLMKMGWKEGEGLGAEGQGRKGNVTVRKAVEQRGLGFNSSGEHDSAVVKQIHGLDQVLASLQKDHVIISSKKKSKSHRRAASAEEEEEDDGKQSVKKSRSSKAAEEEASSSSSEEEEEEEQVRRPRVTRRRGYQKFLDAKDTSLYSKKDLKAILGGVDLDDR